MSSGYYVQKSSLEQGLPFLGRIISRGTATMEQILGLMNFQKLNVGVAMTLAVLEDFFMAIEHLLLEGYTINTPYFSARLVMKGGFERADGQFIKGEQYVVITLQPGVHMQDLLNRLVLILIDPPTTHPQPTHFTDIATGAEDAIVTPNSMGRLLGSHLKFDLSDSEQGVFALNGQAPEKMPQVGRDTDGEIFFNTTALEGMDSVTFEVRSRTSPNAELRIGRLPMTLSVRRP